MILLVSKEPSGKLVSVQPSPLKHEKKSFPTVISHVESLNELPGKLVSCHPLLK